ncbi:unnamed protein product [marine sediment metagenome]|uniref:Uncharacterized protein n=1 Tax=marine sediment metagenome TaxID=412755 RepID=X1NTB4_9ZZZZ
MLITFEFLITDMPSMPRDIKICVGLLSLVGAITFGLASFNGDFGSRGAETVYSFTYKGKGALVRREDRRLGPDEYYLAIGGGEMTRIYF